jgi:hypothetical protein
MNPDPHIPDTLSDDLRRAYRAAIQVPEDLDHTVLAAARKTVLPKPRSAQPAPLRWRLTKWVGVAAAVILALIIPTQLSQNSQPPTLIAGDFNRDGLIDILDAFALARAQRDGDSSITQADIDAAASAAVRLHRGGGA